MKHQYNTLLTKIRSAMTKGGKAPTKTSYNVRKRIENGENVNLYSFLEYIEDCGLVIEIHPENPKPVHDLKVEYIAQVYSDVQLQRLIADCYAMTPEQVKEQLNNWQFRVRFSVLLTVAEFNNLNITDVCISY